jgi:hypothetical protein
MTLTVEQALAQASLYTDDIDYVLLRLPAVAIIAAAGVVAEIGEPFCALIIDKDEVSLVIPAAALEDFAARLPGHQGGEKHYRLITFDIVLDLTMVGFMARVSATLAEVGVSILPLAAYTRDHILVSADQLNIAILALENLKSIVK